MRVTIIAVGKLKEKFWRDAADEYLKRITPYCRPEIIEVADEGYAAEPMAAEEKRVKRLEWEGVLRRLRAGTWLIALDMRGEQVSSEQFAGHIERLAVTGRSDVTFLIGGSLGLAGEALERADRRLSFSRLTFPHQLMRVLLLEQIYRAFKIIRGEPYHK